jgi:hypothetical protein
MTTYITIDRVDLIPIAMLLIAILLVGYIVGWLHGIRTAEKRFGERFLNDDKNDK